MGADLRHALGWNLIEQRGDELGGGKNLEVALRAPVAIRAAEDAAGFSVVGDFLEGERRAQEIFREAAATGGIVGGRGGLRRRRRKSRGGARRESPQKSARRRRDPVALRVARVLAEPGGDRGMDGVVEARRNSWPQSGQWRRVNPARRSPQPRNASITAAVSGERPGTLAAWSCRICQTGEARGWRARYSLPQTSSVLHAPRLRF
jgi:hypothetical protein